MPTIQESIESYRNYIPPKLQSLKIWMPAIGRRPMFQFAGEHKKNLMDFEEVLRKLANEEWMKARRDHMVKKHGDKYQTALAHLAAILTDTQFCYCDPDCRWIMDDNGNPIKDDKGNKNIDHFGEDQITLIYKLVDDCPGWESWSGKGIHALMERSTDTCQVAASHVNKKTEDGWLAPCELKYHTCFLPPLLSPINKRKIIPPAPEYVKKFCKAVNEYRINKNKSPAKQAKPIKQTGQETSPPAARGTPEGEHPGLGRLLDQYRELGRRGIRFLPNGYHEWGGWHRRLTTMGCPKEKIKEIAKSQPRYKDSDADEIDKSQPFPDPEKQAKIEFDRIKKLFTKHRLELPMQKANTDQNYGVVDWLNLVRPEPIGKFAPRGEIALLAAKAGTGKSCLTLARIAEISLIGFKTLYLSGDMNLVDMRPHLMANRTDLNNFRAIDDLTVLTSGWLDHIMKTWQPDLIVMDSFIDCLSCLASEFMWDEQTQKMGKFDPNSDPMTWVRVFGWLKPWARYWNTSVYGLVHPAKDRFGHDLPHSSKLQGYLHRWDILYRKGSDMRGFHLSAVIRILAESPEGTRIEWNGKRRRNTERMHTMYGLEPANLELLAPEDVDEKIMTMTDVREFEDTDAFLKQAGEDIIDTDDDNTPEGPVLKREQNLDERAVMRSTMSLFNRSPDGYVPLTKLIGSLARRNEEKQHQLQKHLESLANRNFIYLQTVGRGYNIRINPDKPYDFGGYRGTIED